MFQDHLFAVTVIFCSSVWLFTFNSHPTHVSYKIDVCLLGVKNIFRGDVLMYLWVRAWPALVEDQICFPAPVSASSQPPVNSISRKFDALFWPSQVPALNCTYPYRNTSLKINLQKYLQFSCFYLFHHSPQH